MPKAYMVFSYQSAPDLQKTLGLRKASDPGVRRFWSAPAGARQRRGGLRARIKGANIDYRISELLRRRSPLTIVLPIRKRLKRSAAVLFETFGSLKAWSSFRTQNATIRAPDHQIMLLSEAVRAHRLIEEGRVKGVRPADVRQTGQ